MPLRKLREHIQKLWVKLSYLRAMDHHGKIVCQACKTPKSYNHVELRLYYKNYSKYPLHFLQENNYFCCFSCQIDNKKAKIYNVLYNFPYIYYTKYDIIEGIMKLQRLLKNHTK